MSVKFQYTPSAYKSGKTYTAIPNVDAADFSFSRASIATRINEDGFIESVGDNVPRMDYTDGGCPVLLTEPQAENLIEYSNDFSQWGNSFSGLGSSVVVNSNNAISPDGTSNATNLQFDLNGGNTSSDNSLLAISYSATSGQELTSSIWIKSANSNDYDVVLDSDSQQGEIITATNQWQRLETTRTGGNTGIRSVKLGLRGSFGTSDNANILVYEAQLETDSKATSNIPTNGATVVRLADTGIETGDISQYIDSSNFTLEFSAKFSDLNDYISVSSGNSINSVRVFAETSTEFRVNYFSNNVNNNESTKTVSNTFDWHDFKLVFSDNVLDLFVDDIAGSTTIFNTEPRNFTFSRLGLNTGTSGSNSGSFTGQIKSIKIS